MWNTKSLLGPLKEEEIYVSISGPKKINVPFTFSHRLSLVGAFEKAETFQVPGVSFYTRGSELR